jgi:DNA repair protein RecO (recombination protein O)
MPELFTLFQLALEQLPQVPYPTLLLRLFELRLLMVIGYAPQLVYCARCAGDIQPHERTFSPSLGGLLCTACAPQVRQTLTMSPATLEYLQLAIAHEADDIPLQSLELAAQQELEHVLHLHLTARLGHELKSYAFLHL